MKRKRRHVGAKSNLRGRSIQEISANLSGLRERRVCFFTGRVSPMSIGVVVIEVVVHCFDHLPRHLGSAGAVKISNGLVVVCAGERRKTGPDVSSRSYRHYTLRVAAVLYCWLTDSYLISAFLCATSVFSVSRW